LRNLIEVSGSTFSMLPASYIPLSVVPSLAVLQRTVSPALIVLASETLVDWLKHAFITKFNHIRPAVYGRFVDVLCKDLLGWPGGQPFFDQSPVVSRRLGFASIPLACLVVRVVFQAAAMLTDVSHVDECDLVRSGRGLGLGDWLFPLLDPDRQAALAKWSITLLVGAVIWAWLILLKLIIGINLRGYASSRCSKMEERESEDQLNDRKRPPIGVTETERAMDILAENLVRSPSFDTPGKFMRSPNVAKSSTDSWTMENLGRFNMVRSRIW